MGCALYVGLQDENKIRVYAVDTAGGLTATDDVAVAGGPSVVVLGADRRVMYVGERATPAISSFRVDRQSGRLTLLGRATVPAAPTYLAADRTGRYLLSAYYQGGFAAVHGISADGTLGEMISRQDTANGAHAILTDPSNRFAFVPHIAYLNDNVLEPPKNNPGPNVIMQFRFEPSTGQLSPNSPLRVEQPPLVGPRHYCFHPNHDDFAYFSNEQGCSVSLYRMNPADGTLAAMQTSSTLPAGYTQRNTCSQIHFTPSGRFLYVGNRGHNSIAGFAVDAASGHLTPAGHAATEAVPSAFCLDPEGKFLFAAGTATGRLASYRIDGATGALTSIATEAVGARPAAVLAIPLNA